MSQMDSKTAQLLRTSGLVAEQSRQTIELSMRALQELRISLARTEETLKRSLVRLHETELLCTTNSP